MIVFLGIVLFIMMPVTLIAGYMYNDHLILKDIQKLHKEYTERLPEGHPNKNRHKPANVPF